MKHCEADVNMKVHIKIINSINSNSKQTLSVWIVPTIRHEKIPETMSYFHPFPWNYVLHYIYNLKSRRYMQRAVFPNGVPVEYVRSCKVLMNWSDQIIH